MSKIRIFDAGTDRQPKSGYGLISYQLKANLEALGHTILTFPVTDKEVEDVVLWIRPPHYLDYPEFDPNKKNVIFTMCEEEKFQGWKENWPHLLNKADAIIVPTTWNKTVFEKQGVVKPIFVVPLGVNSRDYSGFKTYRFSILTLHDALGSSKSRENWKDTLLAYYRAFAGKYHNSVLLTIKSYNIKRDEFYQFKSDVQPEKDAPPVEVIELDLLPREMNTLYANHHLFIKNANREGWSLPLLEAMSTDLPVAFTDLPVFEWAQPYYNKHIFKPGDVNGLVDILKGQFNIWKKKKSFINSLSWKQTAKKVEGVLLSLK